MRGKKSSISFKVNILLIISVLIVMSISSIVIYLFESNHSKKIIYENAKLTIERLANNLKEPLWNIDKKETKVVIDFEVKSHDIYYIMVFDQDDNFSICEIKDKNENIISYNNEDEENKPLINNKLIFLKLRNDIIKNNEKIGSVEIGFTDYQLRETLKTSIIKNISQAIALTFVIVLLIYLSLNKLIINPIINLNRVVTKFSEKDFKARAKVFSNDEIGNLAENFNQMAETIEEYSEHLEDLVEKRTEELNIANKELTAANIQMKKELQMAQQIQEAMIPKVFPDNKIVNLSGMYIPMADLGGDYYDVFKISDSKIGIVIADVCGHGVPAALITTMAKVSFSNNTIDGVDCGTIVSMVNNELVKVIGEKEYLTAFYCIIDTEKKVIEYTNAAHNDIFIFKKNGDIIELKQNSPIIGFTKDIQFNSSFEKIDIEDKIVFYTDGIPETMNDKNELFGHKRMCEIIKNNFDLPPNEIIKKIIDNVSIFSNFQPPADDMTILIANILPGEEKEKIKVDLEIHTEKKSLTNEDENEKLRISLDLKFYEAIEFFKNKEYHKSRDLLEEISEKYPNKIDNFKVYNILGNVYYSLKEFDKSISCWEKALIIEPNNQEIRNNITLLKNLIEKENNNL